MTRRLLWVACVVVAVSLFAGAVGGALGVGFATATRTPSSPLGSPNRTVAALAQRPPQSFAAIAARVLPSVVTIKVPVSGGTALGSGFVISADGYVLTNDHVISGGSGVSVVLNDGNTVNAKMVGRDPNRPSRLLPIDNFGQWAGYAPFPDVAGDRHLEDVGLIQREGSVWIALLTSIQTGSSSELSYTEVPFAALDASTPRGSHPGATLDIAADTTHGRLACKPLPQVNCRSSGPASTPRPLHASLVSRVRNL